MTYPDTFGWDTVFAISIDRVNVALGFVPDSPQYSTTTPVTGGSSTVEWTFTNWRVTDTPGGNRIVVTMDFGPESRMTSTGSGMSPLVALDAPQWSCEVTLRAHFDATDPMTHKLRAITASGESWAEVLVNPGAGSTATFKDCSVLQLMIVDWFNSSEEAVRLFAQEFASVDVGSDVGSDSLAWLRPRRLGYAGAVMADGVTKAMGILAMTTDKSPVGVTLELSPYAMLPNAAAGYVVSRELVMRNMILPACQSAFSEDGVGSSRDFALDGPESSRLRNVGELRFQQECDGKPRDATLAANALTLTLEGEELHFKMTPLNVTTGYPGLSLNATIEERLKMDLLEKTSATASVPGPKFFALTAVSSQPPQVEAVASTGLKITEAAVALIAFALTAALTVKGFKGPLMRKWELSEKSAKLWSRIIAVGFATVGTLAVMGPEWMRHVLEGKYQDIPPFGPVLSEGLVRISWPGIGETRFEAVSGQFANGMLITIDPKFG